MSLSEVLLEIKKVKPHAEEDVDSGPVETLNGRRGRKRQAQETIVRLKRDYKNELLRTAVFIVVTGSERDALTALATADNKCFSADPEAFYKELAKRIPTALYKGKESVSGLFDVLGRHLEDKANELEISQYNQLIFRQEYRAVVENADEFAQLVKRAVNDQIGSEIVGINAVASLVKEAIEKEHEGRYTRIVLNTGDEKLAISLNNTLKRLSTTTQTALIVAGKGTKTLRAVEGAISVKEVNEENVEKALTQVKNSLKK